MAYDNISRGVHGALFAGSGGPSHEANTDQHAGQEKLPRGMGTIKVIIVARKTGERGGEHCTTYGVNTEHCQVAARCGDYLKFKVMGWHEERKARMSAS